MVTMRTFIAICLMVSFEFMQNTAADPVPYCHGDYAKTSGTCSKFGFKKGQDSQIQFHNKFRKSSNITHTANWDDSIEMELPSDVMSKIEMISNVFENGDLVMGFAYVQDLKDGRGYTAGYLGFCTGTGDAFACVTEYAKRQTKRNVLAKYLPDLAKLAKSGSGSTNDIKQYYQDWTLAACTDPIFVQTQLDVGRSMNLKPAVNYAKQHGVTSNLGISIFYDTIMEQGIDCDTSTGAISIDRLLKLLGSRKSGQSEQDYLVQFLHMRRQMLCCFPDDVWPPSSDRVSDLQALVSKWDENKDLANPIVLVAYGQTIHGKEQHVYDTMECPTQARPTQKTVPTNWKLPAAVDLPIPDLC